MCSFYRPPNNNVIPIATLNKSLSDIFRDETLQSPQIIVAGDFNLPSISWIDQGRRKQFYCGEATKKGKHQIIRVMHT